ncbi:MAG: DUF45 domain-containing protein, partial [Haliea sp.]
MHKLLQLTLDLFDVTAPAAPRELNPEVPVAPVAPVARAQGAIESVAKVPAESLDDVFAQASFRHPRANREALLGASRIAYELRRARRRNIGFLVGAEGLAVTAPKWVPLYEIDAAVQSKSAWILRKLHETSERQQRVESARIEWKEGASFPFLGEPVILVLDPRHAWDEVGAVLNTDADALPGVPRLTLHVGLPHTATQEQIR